MKKLIAAMLCAVMTFGLCACSSGHLAVQVLEVKKRDTKLDSQITTTEIVITSPWKSI